MKIMMYMYSVCVCFSFYSQTTQHNSKLKNTIIQKIMESPASKYDALQVKCNDYHYVVKIYLHVCILYIHVFVFFFLF